MAEDQQREAIEKRRREVIESAARSVISTLTVKQRRFVIEYLVHGNATKAAETAGYADPNKQGSRLRHTKQIQDAINAYFREQEMASVEVIARLSQYGRAEYADYLRADGQGHVSVDVQALIQDGKAHLIKGVKETQFGQVIEFQDSMAALVHLGRYHALFTDKTQEEHTGDKERPIVHQFDLSNVPLDLLHALATQDGPPAEPGKPGGAADD